jgi:F-type H+-transporting ATPase subunit alpha
VIYAGVNGYLDKIAVEGRQRFEKGLLAASARARQGRAGGDPRKKASCRRDRDKLKAQIDGFAKTFA